MSTRIGPAGAPIKRPTLERKRASGHEERTSGVRGAVLWFREVAESVVEQPATFELIVVLGESAC